MPEKVQDPLPEGERLFFCFQCVAGVQGNASDLPAVAEIDRLTDFFTRSNRRIYEAGQLNLRAYFAVIGRQDNQEGLVVPDRQTVAVTADGG